MISARALVPLVSGDLFVQILSALLRPFLSGESIFSCYCATREHLLMLTLLVSIFSPSDEVKQNYIHGTLLHVSNAIRKLKRRRR